MFASFSLPATHPPCLPTGRPPNAHVVRYYGLWAPGHRERFRRAQVVLGAELVEPVPLSDPKTTSYRQRRTAYPKRGADALLRQPMAQSVFKKPLRTFRAGKKPPTAADFSPEHEGF